MSIEPVVIAGDAGAQALLRRYEASALCSSEKQSVLLSCPAIGLGVLNTFKDPLMGIASSFHASVVCGKELRSLSDCREQAEALLANAVEVIADCHDRGGNVIAGASHQEIICEVEP